ncbi:carbohydrate-binding module family 21 protein [Phycomyces blakesleeanus]|uniref:Carbohydrate-binding module family 21 protein n=2 Tax=Phycomyces blakesleeanus TaxID=4837 RepID=A0A167R2W0_PHYB8|nr:carbohydrate-binding module family 21 protein [Phycomyces blakesleeanus NRRL 1555(-)]OAD80718.1 carbohydrate-binding module family 21 protein [Phycomyces blakesleeanus NRRL 1555(-)]|eukprot:XP_018298758.1 carbohydrate-binding module family 21 protein [Phycomyces blakesleeanus NRRL 1555(-)]
MAHSAVFTRHESHTWKRITLKRSPVLITHSATSTSTSTCSLPSSPLKPPISQAPRIEAASQRPCLRTRLSSSSSSLSSLSSLRSKSVRFDPELEKICLFQKSHAPSTLKEDNETLCAKAKQESLGIVYMHWPARSTQHTSRPIRVEKKLDVTTTEIVGQVQVRNLAYHKTVWVRYTFDCWQTVENVEAVYREPVGGKDPNNSNYDIFIFTIQLNRLSTNRPANNNVLATLDFAVQYTVDGREVWDNNEGKNYSVQLIKSVDDSEDKTRDRYRDRDSLVTPAKLPAANSRSRSMVQVTREDEEEEDNLWGPRYDFGNSITQARRNPPVEIPKVHSPMIRSIPTAKTTEPFKQPYSRPVPIPQRQPRASILYASSPPNAAFYHGFPIVSFNPSSPTSCVDLNSSSYMDLVNKYCFYGTSPTRSPMPING